MASQIGIGAIHRGEDQPVHHPLAAVLCVGVKPESTEVDLQFTAGFTVGHRHRGLPLPEPQFRCGIPMQRSIRHHHTMAPEQCVHLGQGQPLFSHV